MNTADVLALAAASFCAGSAFTFIVGYFAIGFYKHEVKR